MFASIVAGRDVIPLGARHMVYAWWKTIGLTVRAFLKPLEP